MNWFEPVWLYCERGTSTEFLAEPVNALATFSYVFAGVASLWLYKKLRVGRQSGDHLLLIGLAFLAGFGGLAFHLFANQWSELAHLVPMLLFMLVYLAFALNRFLQVPPGVTGLASGLFVLVTIACMTMTCAVLDTALQPAWSITGNEPGANPTGATSCLNGSFTYFPALIVLSLLTWNLYKRRHKAAKSLLIASLLLLVALIFLALDHLTCSLTQFRDHKVGVHFIWHVLGGVIVFILLRASMLHQDKPLVQEIIPPRGKHSNN